MKAISVFKKAAIPALVLLLILAMTVSVIPMVSADDASAPAIKSTSLILSGDITLVTYFEADETLVDSVKVTVGNATPKTYAVTDLTLANGRWAVEASLAAAQLTTPVTFQWYKGGNTVGAPVTTNAKEGYVDKVFDAAVKYPSSNYVKLVAPLKSMLNYGAMAQQYFAAKYPELLEYGLANDGVYDDSNPIDGMTVANMYGANAHSFDNDLKEQNGVTFKGAQAFYESAVQLRIYFDAPEGSKAYISIGGEPIQSLIRSDATYGSYVNINNVASFNFDKMYTVTIKDANDNELHSGSFSVLGYAKQTLENWKNDNTVSKNTVKALYQHFAWMKNYKDSSFKPGPTETVCAHARSYVASGAAFCSDCGAEISTRLGLKAEASTAIVAGVETDVTFTLSIAGEVDLKAIITTLQGEGVTLTFKSIEVLGDGTGNIQGDAAINIVLDAATAIENATQLAKITYTVEAAAAGAYAIVPTVREAYGENNVVIENITTSCAVIEVKGNINTCAHAKEYDSDNGQHRAYCNECKVVGAWEDHTAGSWTHVLAAEGGKVTGELYEAKICSVCNNAAETRKLYYYNSIDSVRVNDTVINPRGTDATTKNQTVGIVGAPASGYNTFVVSPENFIDASKNLITFHDNDSFKTGGWFAVNGGVARYVIRINDGEWQSLSGGYDNVTAESGIGKAIVGNANITDKEGAFNNANYQGLLVFSDFEAYANQTIKITLGAVPAANPGTAENPNVLITAVIENLFVECTHLSENAASVTATDDPTVFIKTCKCGNVSETSDVNEYGNKMFNADEIFARSKGQGGSNYSVTKMEENGLSFVHFELSKDKTNATEYLFYFANNTATAPTINYGLGKYFIMVYRANEKYNNELVVYANQGSWLNVGPPISDDSEWHVFIADCSKLIDTTKPLPQLRLDIFDAIALEKGTAIDIAYAGFFADGNKAMDNYKKAVDLYGFDKANFRVNIDGLLVNGTKYTNNTGPVAKFSGAEYEKITVDLTNYPLETINKSLVYNGWIVTPSGAKSISYRIIDKDGNASELRHYLTPEAIGANNGIYTSTIATRYGTGCLAGAAFQAANKYFDFTGYDGQTVTVEVVLTNYWGQTATVMTISNVQIPECSNHALYVVEAKEPTCATPGHESYKTCDSCGKIYDLNDVELDAIPEIAIDETKHVVVDKALLAPTNTADGYAAHKACSECGKIWSVAGEELDAAPAIAKLVPTVNKYIGYNNLKAFTVAGAEGSNFKVSANADRTYVRYETTGYASDGYIQLFTGNKDVTGQYLVIKYRTNFTTGVQIWANTEANGHDSGKASYYDSFSTDGNWHIKVIDLAAKLPNYVKANADGEYVIQWARMDILDSTTQEAGKYFDIGFVVYTDDLSKVSSVVLEGDDKFCPHSIAADAVWTLDPNDIMFEKTDCTMCGGKAERYITTTPDGNIIFTPGTFKDRMPTYGKGTVKLVKDENGMPYYNITLNTSVTGEQTVFLYADTANPVTNIGKYVAVLYRTSITDNRIEVVADSTLSNVQQGVHNFGTDSARTDMWTFKVKAYNSYGSEANASKGWYNGEKFTAFRFDYFNPSNAANYVAGESTDVAFVAYFDTLTAAYEFYSQYVSTYGLGEYCQHLGETATWSSADKLYTFNCPGCGRTSTSDMIYKTEAITDAASIGSSSNFLTATTMTEGDETFVRYTPGSKPSDPYFYPIRYNTHVTGNYMVIKYRVTNAGKTMTTSALFASSAASGISGAAGGNTSTQMYFYNTNLYADGEWHYLVVIPKDANTTFTPNADGTYTWAYLRMRLNNFAAADGSCYFDVAEIAFADTAEAAEYYAREDADVNFTTNFDSKLLTLNGTSLLGASKRYTGVWTLDMSQYAALQTPTSLKMGGWACTPGGVKGYYVRVTSVDGVAVENPTLTKWASTTNRSDIVAVGEGLGYSSACAKGAGIAETAVDLTAYAGKTVDFELVAITNYGVEAVYTKVINVTVPAAE